MEEWRDINGYEGSYQVSNKGRVKSLARIVKRSNGSNYTVHEKIISAGVGGVGYKVITLWRNNKVKMRSVHSLVAEMFLNKTEGKECVNHIDGDKLNNNLENLEWSTYSENNKHAYDTGLKKRSQKLDEKQIESLGRELIVGEVMQKDLAVKYGVSRAYVSRLNRVINASFEVK